MKIETMSNSSAPLASLTLEHYYDFFTLIPLHTGLLDPFFDKMKYVLDPIFNWKCFT